MTGPDLYAILGVPRGADQTEIRRAYRRLARELHPDVNPGDPGAEARFKEVTAAYEILGDPKRRAQYDRFGHIGARRGSPAGTRWPSGGQVPDLEEILGAGLGELFETVFGGRSGATRGASSRPPSPKAAPTRAKHEEREIELDLGDAIEGTTRRLEVSGRKIEARIPAGVREGSRVRIRGAAENGRDLVLKVRLRPDHRFTIDGDDLRVRVEVDLFDALLGGESIVDLPGGALRLTIPPGTANGRVFRLKERGLPLRKEPGRRGDLLAKVEVVLPEDLDAEELATFEMLRDGRRRAIDDESPEQAGA